MKDEGWTWLELRYREGEVSERTEAGGRRCSQPPRKTVSQADVSRVGILQLVVLAGWTRLQFRHARRTLSERILMAPLVVTELEFCLMVENVDLNLKTWPPPSLDAYEEDLMWTLPSEIHRRTSSAAGRRLGAVIQVFRLDRIASQVYCVDDLVFSCLLSSRLPIYSPNINITLSGKPSLSKIQSCGLK